MSGASLLAALKLLQFIYQVSREMMKATAISILILFLVKFSYSSSLPTNCTQVSADETRCTVLLVEGVSSNVLVFDTAMYLTCSDNCVVTGPILYHNHFKEDHNNRILTKVLINRESMVSRTNAPFPVIINVVVYNFDTNSRVSINIHIIDLNDNVPQFLSGGTPLPDTMTISKHEGPAVGALIIELEAVDYDEGLNGTNSYILEQSDPPFFSLEITDVGGHASIARIRNIKPLDREMNESFTLRVIALEGTTEPRNDTLTLIITITDIDDNPPVFEQTHYNIILPQWTMVGEELITLTAHDDDIGSNSNIQYTIQDVCAELNPPDGDCVAVPKSGWPFSMESQMGILMLSHFVSCMLADYRVIVNAANPNNPHGGLATAIVWIQTVAHPQDDNNDPVVTSMSPSLTITSTFSKSTRLSSVLTQSSTTLVRPIKPTLTPPVTGRQCDDRIADYCLTAGAGGIALLFLSLFFNVVLLATIISNKKKKKSVNIDVLEKKEHNRVLPPPPSPCPTYSSYIAKSQSSANTADYDTVDYDHVEIINTIYESVDDHKLTETTV